MAIYMEYEDVKGDSTADGFKDMIVLDSFNFGVSRGISARTERIPPARHAEPSFGEVTVTMTMASIRPRCSTKAWQATSKTRS